MDDPAKPITPSVPPWHVTDTSDSPNTSLGGPPGPSVPPVVPPIPEPILSPLEMPVPQSPTESSLPPPPPPFPAGGSETPFVIRPAPTADKSPKKAGGKAVLIALIFFFIALTTGVGFYFFQKGGLPFNLGKKAAEGSCCTLGGSPTGCAANENCVNDPAAAQAKGCVYTSVCKAAVTGWAQQRCADIWYNGGYGNIPSNAQCCCAVVQEGCDKDCRWASDGPGSGLAKANEGKIYMQHCNSSWQVDAQEISTDYDCLKRSDGCTGIRDTILAGNDVDGTPCGYCNNRVWYFRKKITPTPTIPITLLTPTPTTPVTKVTPTPSPICLSVEAHKKGATGLANILPGDTVVIVVSSTATVTDIALRISHTGADMISVVVYSSSSGVWLENGKKWQYEYTIPVGEIGEHAIEGFVKSGGVWK